MLKFVSLSELLALLHFLILWPSKKGGIRRRVLKVSYLNFVNLFKPLSGFWDLIYGGRIHG